MALQPTPGPFVGQSMVRQRTEQEFPKATQSLVAHGPADTTVGTSATTLYTVPENKFFLMEEITITNVVGGTETFTFYVVPDGGVAGTGNAVVYQEQIAANTSLRLTTLSKQMFEPKGIFQAKSSSSGGINVTFWGVELTGI